MNGTETLGIKTQLNYNASHAIKSNYELRQHFIAQSWTLWRRRVSSSVEQSAFRASNLFAFVVKLEEFANPKLEEMPNLEEMSKLGTRVR